MLESSEPIAVGKYLSGLNRSLATFGARVVGEVTSVNEYPKQLYFKIKDPDQDALLSCTIWKTNYDRGGTRLEVGTQVILTGIPEIYAPSGNFSFRASTVELSGEGKLKQEYDKLKEKLEKAGIFSDTRKRALPLYPKKIGIITSKAGVVLQDFTTNIGQHGFEFLFINSRVEGKDALHELHASIETMAKANVDVLVLIRGGGSLEALQAFNNESLVQAIVNFPVPVMTGIGHDTDVTLVQMAADFAGSTPSIVAKKLNEPWIAAKNQLAQSELKTFTSFERSVAEAKARIARSASKMSARFSVFEKKILGLRRDTENALNILKRSIYRIPQHLEEQFSTIESHFTKGLSNVATEILSAHKIYTQEQSQIASIRESLKSFERQIQAFSPERNLALGYSLNYQDGQLLRKIGQVKVGGSVETRVSDGSFLSKVEELT
jgi:exodeoxyribonuclease VII large subunit